jgi:hypothetical protein
LKWGFAGLRLSMIFWAMGWGLMLKWILETFKFDTFHTYSDFGLINIGFNNCDSGFSYLVIGSDRIIVGMESVTLALFFLIVDR